MGFYVGDDQIETTHKYKYFGVNFYSHGYFETSTKRRWIASMKALMTTLRKKAIVGVTCWELKVHLLKALMVPASSYCAKILGVSKNFRTNFRILGPKIGYANGTCLLDFEINFISFIALTCPWVVLKIAWMKEGENQLEDIFGNVDILW